MSVHFRNKNENLWDFVNNKEAITVIYGATSMARFLVEKEAIKVDYLCDRNANELRGIVAVPCVTPEYLSEILKTCGKRATVLVCTVSRNGNLINSVYSDLCKFDINVDLFDYFDNEYVFNHKSFYFRGKQYSLYEHGYNCGYINTIMTERSVELALGCEYINNCGGEIIEIGAVTPYYFTSDKIESIVDPTDEHNKVDKRISLFDVDLTNKNVISISTVEHIGMGDYGFEEDNNSVNAINKIISEAKSYYVSFPVGYNKILDDWLIDNKDDERISILQRRGNNYWYEIEKDNFHGDVYGPYAASSIAVILKQEE